MTLTIINLIQAEFSKRLRNMLKIVLTIFSANFLFNCFYATLLLLGGELLLHQILVIASFTGGAVEENST